jgi:hypothetical protein
MEVRCWKTGGKRWDGGGMEVRCWKTGGKRWDGGGMEVGWR